MDSIFSLLLKSEISSFYPSSEAAQTGFCQTWWETPKTGFLVSWLKSNKHIFSQIWNGINKVKNIDVQALDKHGKIYDADGKLHHFKNLPMRYTVIVFSCKN